MTAPVAARPPRRVIPRQEDDYTVAAARRRMAFVARTAGVAPGHIGRYSFDPAVVAGNIENFVGVAQVPVGIAGPLLVDGEFALIDQRLSGSPWGRCCGRGADHAFAKACRA